MFKKKLSLGIVFIVVLCSLFLGIVSVNASSTYYSDTGIGDYRTIDLSEKQLKNARSNCTEYSAGNLSLSGSIGSKYKFNVYKIKASTDGYYTFYTTGSLDTVSKLYKQKKILFINAGFEEVDNAYNDDGFYLGNGLNTKQTIYLNGGSIYYFAVRAYNAKTGSFTLNVEPNEDKKYAYSSTNTWSFSNGPFDVMTYDGSYMSYTTDMFYFDKDATLLLAWFSCPSTDKTALVSELRSRGINISSYTPEKLFNELNKNQSKVVAAINTVLGAVGLIPGAGVYCFAASTIVTAFDFLINENSKSLTDFYEDVLRDVCGAKEVVNTRTRTSKWNVNYGLVVRKTWCNTIFLNTNYYYSTYSGNLNDIIKGRIYDTGTWK